MELETRASTHNCCVLLLLICDRLRTVARLASFVVAVLISLYLLTLAPLIHCRLTLSYFIQLSHPTLSKTPKSPIRPVGALLRLYLQRRGESEREA